MGGAHEVEGDVADDGHVGWAVTGARSGGVLTKDDVEHQCREFSMLQWLRTVRASSAARILREAILAWTAAAAVEPADVGGDLDDALLDASVALADLDVGVEALGRRIGEEAFDLGRQARVRAVLKGR